jgi:hypothetical protein
VSAPRLSRGRAVVLVLTLGVLLFGAVLPAWAQGAARTTTGTAPVAVSGADAAPGVASAAAVVLVSALVLGLSGRVTRVLAVIGVVGGGVLALVGAIAFLRDPTTALRSAAGQVGGLTELAGEPSTSVWPVLAVVVAGLVTAVGIAMPWLLGRWQQVGRRYERHAGRRQDPGGGPDVTRRVQAMDDWDALSRGEDPTQHGGR